MTTYLIQVITAGIASFGFALLYNVRGKRLIIPFTGGIAGWTLYIMLMFLNSDILQSFIATIFLTIYTEIAARIVKTPTTTFLVPNIIIFIPGGLLYFTISSAIRGDWLNFMFYGKETLFMAASIAAGIMIVSSLVKIIYKLKPDNAK